MSRKFVVVFCVSMIAFFVFIGFPLPGQAEDDFNQQTLVADESVVQIHEQAELGDPEAQNYLGMVALYGFAGEPDYQAALEWFTRAADQGFEESIVQIGVIYENGFGVEADLLKAAEYYQQAVDLNWPIAFFRLGLLNLRGVPEGTTVGEGLAMLQKSCETGYQTGCGMRLYYDLKFEEALEIFEGECQIGDDIACVMANDVDSRLAKMQTEQSKSPVEEPAQEDNTNYLLIALALLLGAGGVWFFFWKSSAGRDQGNIEPPAEQ
ncbi:MAG: sel1 repeat family protein [Proteobacteria bacterium]|nr:sel1 repeat family protein [Pseudomonadota bacterium]MBU1738395.1 sel1 repeat family protein [Pseudomonadota bacterium]